MATVTLESGAVVGIADPLYNFVRDEALKGTAWTAEEVFRILGELVQEFDPKNRELLARRVDYQRRIDEYYVEKREAGWRPTPETAERDASELEGFLVDIGFLAPGNARGVRGAVPEGPAQWSPEGHRPLRAFPGDGEAAGVLRSSDRVPVQPRLTDSPRGPGSA